MNERIHPESRRLAVAYTGSQRSRRQYEDGKSSPQSTEVSAIDTSKYRTGEGRMISRRWDVNTCYLRRILKGNSIEILTEVVGRRGKSLRALFTLGVGEKVVEEADCQVLKATTLARFYAEQVKRGNCETVVKRVHECNNGVSAKYRTHCVYSTWP